MDFACLKFEARNLDLAHIRMVEPDVLIGEDKLPVEGDGEDEQDADG